MMTDKSLWLIAPEKTREMNKEIELCDSYLPFKQPPVRFECVHSKYVTKLSCSPFSSCGIISILLHIFCLEFKIVSIQFPIILRRKTASMPKTWTSRMSLFQTKTGRCLWLTAIVAQHRGERWGWSGQVGLCICHNTWAEDLCKWYTSISRPQSVISHYEPSGNRFLCVSDITVAVYT